MVCVTTAPWPSVDNSTCKHCGAYVSDQFCRVYGDNNDRAHRCGDCDSYRRLTRGSAAGVAVTIPDPEIAEGHHGGEADV
ncbi:DUF7563 family protein [Natronorubrum tibetense]|uniref:Small CPxCG-related zinc finger protein n=1 Tax=Natronorubrum tibetense GA33 TaxID=1114856 RepID=L9W9X0_9EURY|nr:hypothetical protein [Natronorubrum tibetense]ELY46167.1 hypothetical protein C496_01331 [Natronorubrum tibetense GA33]